MKKENQVTLSIIMGSVTALSFFIVAPWSDNPPWGSIMNFVDGLGLSKKFVFWQALVSGFVAFNLIIAISQKWITRTNPWFCVFYSLAIFSLLSTYASKSYYNMAGVVSGLGQAFGVLYGLYLFFNGIREKAEQKVDVKKLLGVWVVFAFGFVVAYYWPSKEQSDSFVYDIYGAIGATFTATAAIGFSSGKLSTTWFNRFVMYAAMFMLLSALGQYNPGAVAPNSAIFLIMAITLATENRKKTKS